MAGLDPAIHEACRPRSTVRLDLWNVIMDRRVKPGDDELGGSWWMLRRRRQARRYFHSILVIS
jgi:hypothetical protein